MNLVLHLPKRLEVGNGEIVDSNGQRSRQTDVIIVSEDGMPRMYRFDPILPYYILPGR